MSRKQFKIKVSPEIGEVSAISVSPARPFSVLTLAHGAGAGMDHSFMEKLATALSEAGIATLRFNFLFAEQNKFRPDSPAVAHQVVAAAFEKATKLFPTIPLYASGKSFGGRMSSQLLSAAPYKNVKGLIFFGFPLHPAGKPSRERAVHLSAVNVPMLFLQGSKDALATWQLIEEVCESLPLATLVRFEGADHSFKAGKRDIMAELVEAVADWLKSQMSTAQK